MMHSLFIKRELQSCSVNQTIDNEKYAFDLQPNSEIERFHVSDNGQSNYLPKHIGEHFPNLLELSAERCGLIIVRDFYFKDMKHVKFLNLRQNKIVTIEPESFKDLVSVEEFWLESNLIERLDEKLFAPMEKLIILDLSKNKINFLSPEMFNIQSGNLYAVYLKGNICYNGDFFPNPSQLEPRTNCTN